MSAEEIWTRYERTRERALKATVLLVSERNPEARLGRAHDAVDLLEAAMLLRFMAEGGSVTPMTTEMLMEVSS